MVEPERSIDSFAELGLAWVRVSDNRYLPYANSLDDPVSHTSILYQPVFLSPSVYVANARRRFYV